MCEFLVRQKGTEKGVATKGEIFGRKKKDEVRNFQRGENLEENGSSYKTIKYTKTDD